MEILEEMHLQMVEQAVAVLVLLVDLVDLVVAV
jgi:hypothetical protein